MRMRRFCPEFWPNARRRQPSAPHVQASQRLRHHRAEHVRALSAESLGFLFRCACWSHPAVLLRRQCWCHCADATLCVLQSCRPVHQPNCAAALSPPPRRQASGPAIRVGVKAALAEAVTRPTDERVHAAGALLAEAVTGVSHGLHSRAAAVLGPVLREGVLRPDDFKSAKVRPTQFCCIPSCVVPAASAALLWLVEVHLLSL